MIGPKLDPCGSNGVLLKCLFTKFVYSESVCDGFN